MAINVCFSTTDGLFSRIIRWFTKSKASHALITFRDETLDSVFVMEANGRGFMLVPWARWRKGNTLVVRYELAIPEGEQLSALRAVSASLGLEYDYVSLIGFLWRRFTKRMSNPFSSSKKLVCSEAVARFLYAAGFDKFDDAGSWTPEDMLQEIADDKRFVAIGD
jgi:hypothetical protein